MASLRKAFEYNGHVVAEYGEYHVYVEDGEDVRAGKVIDDPKAGMVEIEPEIVYGYWLTVHKGEMPAHASHFFRTLDEVEDYERRGELFGRADLDWEPIEAEQ